MSVALSALRSSYRAAPTTPTTDVLITAITSVTRSPSAALAFGEASLTDWQSAGLIKPSAFKPVFAAIEQRLIIKRLGAVAAGDAGLLRTVLTEVIG